MISFFKRIFRVKRYFVCFYSFSVKNGQNWGNGNMIITNDAGEYFSSEWVREEVSRELSEKNSVDSDQVSVAITGMVELSKRDWNAYRK